MKMAQFGNRVTNLHKQLPNDILVILLSSFLIPLGSFMVVPFLPILLSNKLKMGMSAIGFLLGMVSFIQFGGGILGGIIAHNYGIKNTMVIALTVRTVGFICLFLSMWYPMLLMVAAILIAAGAAGYLPANKAYICSRVDPSNLAKVLAISSSCITAGMSIGPLFGGLFFTHYPYQLFWVVSLIFFVITYIHIKNISQHLSSNRFIKSKVGVRAIGKMLQANAGTFTVIMLTSYIFFFFFHFLGPYVASVASIKFFSLLLLINSGMICFLQLVFSNRIKNTSYYALMCIVLLSLGCGYLCFSYGEKSALLLGCVLISSAEGALFLKNDLVLTTALPQAPAIAFGLQRLCIGTASLMSAVAGGILYEYCNQSGSLAWLWIIVSVQAFFLVTILGACIKSGKIN